MRAFTVRLTTVVVLVFSGTAIARAQDSTVQVVVGPSPDAPTTHAYVTEFFRQRSGCRSLVVPLGGLASYIAFFEFRSGEGHSVLVWGSRPELSTFSELLHETSGEQTIADIVRNVCDFIKTQ